MTKALFFDRDGVINVDKQYVYKTADFEFVEGIFDLMIKYQKLGYLLIVVTNQAGIARGYYTKADFEALNSWMIKTLLEKGIVITKTYYNPYHPTHGMGEYLKESEYRKPNPGMILKAKEEFDINLEESILIGDKSSDIIAGRRAGVGKLVFLKGKYELDESDDVLIINSLSEL